MLEKIKTQPITGTDMSRFTYGFSLVELMVTLAVLAIIASIAAPSFQNMRDRARVKSATESVYSHMQFARTESVKQDRNLNVAISSGGNWCIGISNSAGCDCNTPGSCQFGPADSLAEHNIDSSDFSGITLTSNQSNVAFDSRRGTINNAATVNLTGTNSHTASIILSTRGRIRICGNVGGYPAC